MQSLSRYTRHVNAVYSIQNEMNSVRVIFCTRHIVGLHETRVKNVTESAGWDHFRQDR